MIVDFKSTPLTITLAQFVLFLLVFTIFRFKLGKYLN